MPLIAHYGIAEKEIALLLPQYLAYIKREYALATWKNQKYSLTPFFEELGVAIVTQLTLYDLDEAIAAFTKQWKPSSTSTFKQHVRSFFLWCIERQGLQLAFNPVAIKRRKHKPEAVRTFSKEDIKQVIQGCKQEQDRLIIALMFETGMRISEVLRFRIEDLNLLEIQVYGKGRNQRVVHISSDLSTALREYKARRRLVSGCFFRPLQRHKNHPNDCYKSAYAVRDRVKREFKSTLGVAMHPHQIRHSFAIEWLRHGGDIRTLQILMGHDSIETTQAYLHLTDKQTGDIYYRVFSESVLT